MKKKNITLFVFIWGMALTTAFSQSKNVNKEVYPVQASIEHNEAVKNFSRDYITAFPAFNGLNNLGGTLSSMENTAIINMIGSDNNAGISQRGYNIMGVINIEGSNNNTQLIQTGLNLSSNINVEGNFNEFGMTQLGIGLQNDIQISGSNLQFNALHTNFGFQLQQQGIGAVPLSIQNTGRSIPIIIKNN
jgi:hypothetical protein